MNCSPNIAGHGILRPAEQGKGKEGDRKGHEESESEKALLEEMKQMRIQIAQLMEVSQIRSPDGLSSAREAAGTRRHPRYVSGCFSVHTYLKEIEAVLWVVCLSRFP